MESMQSILATISFDELQKTSQQIQTSSGEISVYQGGQLTEKAVIEETEKILIAFPKIEPQMVKLLRERFKANGFNDERMRDAVNFVIDNYTGYDKLPSIADFIRFDKKVKTYTYTQLFAMYKDSYYQGAKYDPIAQEYDLIKVDDQIRYVRKEDAKKYKLQILL